MALMEPTPKILCHGRQQAKILEEILNRIKGGATVENVSRVGSTVYVHLRNQHG